MPKITQQIRVEVKDKGIAFGKRAFNVAVSANAELFRISDLVVKDGAIQELNCLLKYSTRQAVAEYISNGRQLHQRSDSRKKKNGTNDQRENRAR